LKYYFAKSKSCILCPYALFIENILFENLNIKWILKIVPKMRIRQEEAILGRLLGMVDRRAKIVPNPFSKEVLKSKCS